MQANSLMQRLEETFLDNNGKTLIKEQLNTNLVEKISSLKNACLQEIFKKLSNNEEREKIINEMSMSPSIDKAKCIFIKPFIGAQIRIIPEGKEISRTETTTTDQNSIPEEFKQMLKTLEPKNKKIKKSLSKAEKLLIEFEEQLNNPDSYKILMQILDIQLSEILNSLEPQLFGHIEKFFKDDNKKNEIVNILQSDPIIVQAEKFTFDPIVSLSCQFMLLLEK